jgi:hypothetical protein
MYGQVVVLGSVFAAACCGLRIWADWPGQRPRYRGPLLPRAGVLKRRPPPAAAPNAAGHESRKTLQPSENLAPSADHFCS